MKIKENLALKTSLILTLILLITAIGYSIFIFKKEMKNINTIINNDKNYIINKLNTLQQQNIKKAKSELLKNIDLISVSIKNYLFNMNLKATKTSLNNFIQIQPLIKAIIVKDSLANRPFVIIYKDKNQKSHFGEKLPDYIKEKFNFIKFDLIYNIYHNEKIGEIEVYYDLNPIKKEINAQKKEELEKLKITQKILIQNSKKNLIDLILVFIVTIILINITIFIIMLQMVSNPIKKLQEGLDSFFIFLNNPKEKIKKISYKSHDEIGKMIEKVNKNIEVSAKLHTDISNLLKIIDKNILIITIDKKGIIKNISTAFSNLSGYSKKELKGQNFHILFAPYTDKETVNKINNALKNNHSFKGELKIKTKSGNILYLKIIITPKCSSQDNCNFDILSFDITDKKKVEELLETLEEKVKERTRELAKANEEIKKLLIHIKDSINYASFIQKAILPKEQRFKETFKDYFIIYKPKDIVGGDIYQLIKLNENEYLLMVIDCTGHGVPGAFVTMLIKALSEQIVFNIKENKLTPSPNAILNFFNSSVKQILNQYKNSNSKSDVGFEGGIIYYNKSQKKIIFSGAGIPLFYVKKNNINMIKGDRISIGYKKSKENYQFKESVINLEENMKFYITTDGFIDQNGGEKNMPFGKKRFKKIIEKYHNLPFSLQKEKFLQELKEWQNGFEQTDDITLIAFEL